MKIFLDDLVEEMSPPLPGAPVQLWSPDPARFSILAAVPGEEEEEEKQRVSQLQRKPQPRDFISHQFMPVPAVPREDTSTLPSPTLPFTLPSLTTSSPPFSSTPSTPLSSTFSPPFSSNPGSLRLQDEPSFLRELVDVVQEELSRRPKQTESTISNLPSFNSFSNPSSTNSIKNIPSPKFFSDPHSLKINSKLASGSKSSTRKAYRSCHGSCVQKFCLPVQDLQVYETCQSKCRDLCL